MNRLCLIACSGQKLTRSAPACDLYCSSLFVKSRQWMEAQNFPGWYILSAKYGLLEPDRVIAPYDVTLNAMSVTIQREWAQGVWERLKPIVSAGDEITILAGERYRKFLEPPLEKYGCKIDVPMAGLRIGEQLQWLDRHLIEGRP